MPKIIHNVLDLANNALNSDQQDVAVIQSTLEAIREKLEARNSNSLSNLDTLFGFTHTPLTVTLCHELLNDIQKMLPKIAPDFRNSLSSRRSSESDESDSNAEHLYKL